MQQIFVKFKFGACLFNRQITKLKPSPIITAICYILFSRIHVQGTAWLCVCIHIVWSFCIQALLQATYAMGYAMGPVIGGGLQEVSSLQLVWETYVKKGSNALPCFV